MAPDTTAGRDPFLVVGLGNPGAEYEATPHNFGWLVVDELARRADIRLRLRECQSLTGRGEIAGRGVWLAKPLTYMNLSGAAVKQLLEKQAVVARRRPEQGGRPLPGSEATALSDRRERPESGVEYPRWLVICDELDLPLGSLRLRERGSAGSHNGLRSIVASLGTTEFARLRLGIGPAHAVMDRAQFVLGRWSRPQLEQAVEAAGVAADAVEMILREGMARAMAHYNDHRRGEAASEANEREQ
ncbi:MAG TPA: aminoacyl-tRNA hydrolase [Terriglobales bacterium]|nr:aminoacyl-tRNA hydrolase [Terriglobales bacterium]